MAMRSYTSPRSRRILKLRLFIFSFGDEGKQFKQLVKVYNRSFKEELMVDIVTFSTECRNFASRGKYNTVMKLVQLLF